MTTLFKSAKQKCIAVLAAIPLACSAGAISDAFDSSILSIPWGATVAQVLEKFPSAVYKEQAGIRFASVVDGRQVLGMPRKPDGRIGFMFDADGAFTELEFEFPLNDGAFEFNEKMSRLKTIFGEAIGPMDVPMGLSFTWPSEAGIKLTARGQFGVFGIGSGFYVNVRKALQKAPIDKSALGLD